MFPRSGGIYVYIREGLGPAAAFVFGWTYLLITKPLAAAAIATAFCEHFVQLFDIELDHRWVTCALLLIITLLNVIGVRLGAGVAVVLTGLKFLALAGIVVAALLLTKGNAAHFEAGPAPRPFWLALAPALAAILWTYDGWSDVAAVSGEVKEPSRVLPRIFIAGTTATIGLYVAVNAVYLWFVPLEEMRREETIAPLVMQRLLGSAGAVTATLVVLVATMGATHGSILTGARVSFAQARDGLIFSFLGRVHPTHQTPSVSLWIEGILACLVAIWLKDF
jgi:amino acid transporter